ncbi:LysR family transcriptional regulator [Rosenbergiella australiborealis]|uniref:LysR family transcriptional regulator n=1 Tax=Rosenbergiella australiborealis TaxID=1544696 RepID=A0ABS5T4P4_9GAMM|nr:LysR family transcriptional regulator [Rosenbergiella australiborealis]MBT0726450.1 LysR family transcriptional regulator [Rosenbergiella australiborealis]
MQLKLPQLKIFCALVESGSVVQAAKKMHCVPSNISTRIRELEESLTVNLVNRDKQRLTLTPEGRAFYPQAQKLLRQSEECLNFFKPESLHGHLRLGALDVALNQQLEKLMITFMKQNPNVTVSLSCFSSLPLMDRLLAGEVDMILVDGPIDHPVLESQLFAPERLRVVTHCATLDEFSSKVAALTLYTFGEHCFYHVLIEDWLASQQLQARQQCDIESYSMILAAIHQQLGFTVMPESFINDNPQVNGLYCYPLTDISSCDIYLVWRRYTASPVEKTFLALNNGVIA